jgi:hypothetical protein
MSQALLRRQLSRILNTLIAATAFSVGCSHGKTAAHLPGAYTRSSVRLSQGGQVIDAPNDGPMAAFLPSAVTLDNAHGYEVTSSEGTTNGQYRLERDSLFFDEQTSKGIRLAYAGRVLGDTLELHMIPAGMRRDPSNGDVQLRFVRTP